MRHITFSDHTADQIKVAADKRKADFDVAQERFSMAMAARKKKADSLRERPRTEFLAGHYFAWLISFIPRIWHALSSKPQKPVMAAPSREEVVWSAGSEGEQRVTEALSAFLSDDWVLISGYQNQGGEIDKLLIGPLGVMAIEVKFVNGRVFCDGDKWWRDKYDRYGNLVETGVPIADKRGRGPSAQVNAAADRLQSFLSKRSSIQRVARAVVISHDSSEIGRINNQTVDLVATLGQLSMRTIASSMSGGLAGLAPHHVVELIRKDHEFNERPRVGHSNGERGRRTESRSTTA